MNATTSLERLLLGTVFVMWVPLPASAELKSVELAVRGMD